MLRVLFCIFLSAISVFSLTQDGLPGVDKTLSAHTLGHGRMGAGIVNYISTDGTIVKNGLFDNRAGGPDVSLSAGTLLSYSGYPVLSIGLSNFLDLSLTLPIYIDDKQDIAGMNKFTIGDFRGKAKFQVPYFAEKHVADVAIFVGGQIPSAELGHGIRPRRVENILDTAEGMHEESQIFGTRMGAIDYGLALTIDFGAIEEQFQFKWHTNFGMRKTFTKDPLEEVFYYSTALDYNITQFLSTYLGFRHESRFDQLGLGTEYKTEPTEILIAGAIHAPVGINLQLGLIFGLNDQHIPYIYNNDKIPDYNTNGLRDDGYYYEVRVTPPIEVYVELDWTGFLIPQDSDKDGIINKLDACPNEPEDRDNFKDKDGCPEPDNDEDGILDEKDACPLKPEDIDGFQDEDGCIDADNDEDGIPDLNDACPMITEDLDGFEDADGCPDYDNDKDNVPDTTDKCPMAPEDIDNFEDEDGCEDIDNDKDGIPDAKDKCPDSAEVVNNYQDEDGCPDNKPVKKVKKIKAKVTLKGVNFKTGSADLTFESYEILNPIVEQLKAYPEVRIEIRGHTDNVGSRRANQRLSERRAQSVVDYFSRQGISRSRMRASGYGESTPISSNRTARGRRANRRIEMYRIK